ncbi:hypothetical protein SUGI_1064580 [Cryptomeria japonica]|nr:hypothetical protein SUGI_1064580 [Cryptomeria japonica]
MGFSYNFGLGNRDPVTLLWMVMLILPCTAAVRPLALFVFGDSYSDTGNLVELFPFGTDAEKLPFGSTFFGAPSGRFSDGRLIVDFLANDMGFPFIDPYFKNIGPKYRNGIDFAVSGATACDVIDLTSGATACNITARVPFSLQIQIDQFNKFKQNVNSTIGKQVSGCQDLNIAFGSGLYFIFIGTNDMLNGFFQLTAPMDSIAHGILKAISKAIKELYAEEAREFVVFNIPPAGCFPILLDIAGSSIPKDSLNCSKVHNQVIEGYNAQLHKTLQSLQKDLRDATIRIVDIYQFIIDAISHPEDYGFDKTKTLSACFAKSKEEACSRPDKYISWDGVHFTDAFSNHFVEEMVFNNNYVFPPFSLTVRKMGPFEGVTNVL